MARLARLVIPGLPHHITQRGNRRQPTFFNDGDYKAYLELMAEWCHEEGVEIWSYCLMPNHIHLIAVPKTEEGLRNSRDTVPIMERSEGNGVLFYLGRLVFDDYGTPGGMNDTLNRLESLRDAAAVSLANGSFTDGMGSWNTLGDGDKSVVDGRVDSGGSRTDSPGFAL